MRHRLRLFAIAIAILVTSAHRLPAPIQEVPESPTPAPEQSTKTKPRRIITLKNAGKSSESSTKRPTSSPQPKSQSTPTQPRFAGTWAGIINCGILGNIEHTLVVDSTQTSMKVWQTQNPAEHSSGSPHITGDTIIADHGWGRVWSVTPYADGQTARVRFQAFLLDSSAVFRRTSP